MDVHRAYNISTDEYIVRVSGGQEMFRFTGPRSAKDSYEKARTLIQQEQKKDIASKFIDHANHT